MPKTCDVVTFDCYGTLIDWESGIAGAFQKAALADEVQLDRDEVLRTYAQVEPVVESERYRPYREVLTEAAARAGILLGWPLSTERATFLAESLPSWQPFPDTNAALERLKNAGYQLGILSNVDDDLIGETSKHFTVGFDFVITAQQVRSYKPGHAHFLAARERIGDARWLHAAESNFHDIVPTNVLGIANAWINRQGHPQLPGGEPTHRFATLAELADAITDK
jgi:2-haloalkanoic acid dehalogenase type II